MGGLRDRVLRKPKEAEPAPPNTQTEVVAAKITRSATLRAAIIAGSFSAVVSLASLTGGVYVAERNADSSVEMVRLADQLQDEEEIESIVCAEVYERVEQEIIDSPKVTTVLFSLGEDGALLSQEERSACPDYEIVLGRLDPSP